MKKSNLLLLLLTLLIVFTITGCGKESATNSANTSKTKTITDHEGNKVTIPTDIKNIAVCDIYPLPSVLSVFFDSADKIVGMAAPSMTAAKNSLLGELYPEILKAKTDYIDGTNVNTEELLKLNPDIVFYSAGSKDLGDSLRKAGFNAVAISASKWDYNAIETLNNWISLLDEIFPGNKKADIVKKYSDDTYKMIQDKVSTLSDDKKEKAFFLFKYDESIIATSGNHFFGQWWADAIGAKNVGAEISKDNAVPVNMEQIYKWNPSIIYITNFNTAVADDLYDNKIADYNWNEVNAVKDKKVYKMPLGMYRSYTCGVDTPVTLMWLAKTTYPELFKDIDITKKTKEYYKTVFNIDLTDEQANKIFAPVSEAGDGIK